jgi:hypothetical protein
MTTLKKRDIHEDVRFGSLEQGEMFCFGDYYNSNLYLKTETGIDEYGTSINAVCLTGGTTCNFCVDELVIPVDCTIEITRKVVE